METPPDVDLSSFFSNFECTSDESSKKRPLDGIQVVDFGDTVKKTKIDESSVLLQKIEKLRESRRIMKTEIRNAKAEIQELREQMTLLNEENRESRGIMKTEIRNGKAEIQELREQITLLNEKVESLSKKRTYKKNNVMEQLDVIKNILIDMKK